MAKLADFLKSMFGLPSDEEAAPIPRTYAPSPPAVQKQSKPRSPLKPHFEIRDADDAKALFLSIPYANLYFIERNYDEETAAAFQKHTNSEMMRQWLTEHYETVLRRIADGDTSDFTKKINGILQNIDYWGIRIVNHDLFMKTWDSIWNNEMPNEWIIAQMRIYLHRTDYKNDSVFRWMDRAIAYLQTHFSESFQKTSYGDSMYQFKEEVAELRGRRLENTDMDCGCFHFVPMSEDVTDTIFRHYSDKYNGDPAALRECFCDLNCTFGVDDGTLFLTADSKPADSYSHQSWDHYHFMIVLHSICGVYRVECKRDIADGRFRVYSCPDELLPYADAIAQAVTLYRNRPAKDAFEKAMEQKHPGFHLGNAIYDDRKRLMARIPLCFGHLKERLTGNPLAEILEALIDACEEYAPEYGIHNTTFGEPATEEEFKQWEAAHGCKLPENLKDFLRFANGAELPFCSANIFSLDSLGLYDDCMEEGYVSIGDAIGDGTTPCFRKADGEICVADHEDPEMREYGMDGLLEWLMDFAE